MDNVVKINLSIARQHLEVALGRLRNGTQGREDVRVENELRAALLCLDQAERPRKHEGRMSAEHRVAKGNVRPGHVIQSLPKNQGFVGVEGTILVKCDGLEGEVDMSDAIALAENIERDWPD